MIDINDKHLHQYVNDRWYIGFLPDGNILVHKGRTKKKFKLSKYDNVQTLIDDIQKYMSTEKNEGWK